MTMDNEDKSKGSRTRIANFQKILENNPKSFIFAQLAEEYLKLGEVEKATEICQKGLQYNPEFADGLYVLGVAMFKRNQKERACSIFLKILQKQADHYLAREALHRMGFDDDRIAAESANLPAGVIQAPVVEETELEDALSAAAGETEPEEDADDASSEEALTRKARREMAAQQSAKRAIPTSAGDVRSALKLEGASKEDLKSIQDKDDGWPFWLKTLLAFGAVALLVGGYFGFVAYQKYVDNREVAQVLDQAAAEFAPDTYAGYRKAVELLEQGLATHPKSIRIAAGLLRAYSILLIDFEPANLDYQARVESLAALLPPDRISDANVLTGLAYRAFALKKSGDVRFLIDTAREKGVVNAVLISLDGELSSYDRKYEAAVKFYDEALEREPSFNRALYKKGEAQLEMKEAAAAKITLGLLLDKVADHIRGKLLLWQIALFGEPRSETLEQEILTFSEQNAKSLPPSPLGRLLFLQGYIDLKRELAADALSSAQQAVQLFPHPEAFYLLARIQYEQKLFSEAKRNVLKAIEILPEEKTYHALLGRLYFNESNKTKALEEMELAIDNQTQDLNLLVTAGDAAASLKMYDKAVTYYERASFVNLQNIDLEKKLILTIIEKGDMKDAQRRIEKLLQDFPESALPFYLNGKYYLAEEDAAKAEKEFEKGLTIDAANRDIHLEMEQLSIARGDVKTAYEILIKLESQLPADVGVLERLAALTLAADANDLARQYYDRLAKLDPQQPAYRLYLAYLDFLGGSTQSAQQTVEQELSRDPELGLAHILRGLFLFKDGDLKRAEAQIQRGIQLESKNPDGHYWLGIIKVRLDDATWAKNEFEVALECQPIFPKANYEIGNLHFEKTQYEQAQAEYLKAMKTFSLFPAAKTYLVKLYLRLGEIDILRNRYQHGFKLVQQASELDPDAAEPYYIMARDSIDKFRNPEKAIGLLKKAQRLDPNLTAVHYELGLIYMSKDRNKEAREAFEEYLRLDPKGRFVDDAKQQLSKLAEK